MTDTLGLSPDRLARLDSHLAEEYIATRRLPCTLSLIARHGEIAHLHTQGLADVERGIPARDWWAAARERWRFYKERGYPLTSFDLAAASGAGA